MLVGLGAVFGREQGKPHNVLGYIPKAYIELSVLKRKKGKPHNVPGYVPEKISRTLFFTSKGR